MRYEVIDVKAYSGYKHNERPVSFMLRGSVYKVIEIIDRWYEGSWDTREPYMDYFKIRLENGKEYILRYNALFDAWAIMIEE